MDTSSLTAVRSGLSTRESLFGDQSVNEWTDMYIEDTSGRVSDKEGSRSTEDLDMNLETIVPRSYSTLLLCATDHHRHGQQCVDLCIPVPGTTTTTRLVVCRVSAIKQCSFYMFFSGPPLTDTSWPFPTPQLSWRVSSLVQFVRPTAPPWDSELTCPCCTSSPLPKSD